MFYRIAARRIFRIAFMLACLAAGAAMAQHNYQNYLVATAPPAWAARWWPARTPWTPVTTIRPA